MLLAFVTIILSGHFYCSVFVLILSVGMVKEILALKRDSEKDAHVPFSQTVTWYWCTVAIIFFYGKLFSNKLAAYTLSNIGIYVRNNSGNKPTNILECCFVSQLYLLCALDYWVLDVYSLIEKGVLQVPIQTICLAPHCSLFDYRSNCRYCE